MNKRCLMIESDKVVELERDGPALRIRATHRSRQWFPLRRISRIICIGLPSLGLKGLSQTAQEGIPVNFMTDGGELIAQLVHPGALPIPFTHWIEAIDTEPDLLGVYNQWLENQLIRTYAMLGCMACSPEQAALKAETQLAKIFKKQKRGRLPSQARIWFKSLQFAQIQTSLTRLGLSASNRHLTRICNDLAHPALMLSLTSLFLRLPPEATLEGVDIPLFYEKCLSADIDLWITKALYTLSEQLEVSGMLQNSPRHKLRYENHAPTTLSRLL
ncbi:hypothetical protein DN062_11460 [Nitrincola tibetensis]|uniref:Uncharacterized protein n=1 Tax=Nitrincola tibetensis TaxID=2219697 RepID=A0A364NKG2_9GAMM|nr:CRISPR-associated endonuclease Cas1 [Nitrincola tibetensis]RAU17619.1 hypothetical protein DN062_11460 [Nitrincola tibetensis]